MSTNLFWEVVKPSKRRKWAFEREYDVESTLTSTDIPFLRGVRAAQPNEADETAADCTLLIQAIEEHGSVRVWISE